MRQTFIQSLSDLRFVAGKAWEHRTVAKDTAIVLSCALIFWGALGWLIYEGCWWSMWTAVWALDTAWK
jgi:hypothetical protein